MVKLAVCSWYSYGMDFSKVSLSIIICFITVLIAPLSSSAQSSAELEALFGQLNGMGGNAVPNLDPNALSGLFEDYELRLEPSYPEPFSDFTVTLSAPSSDTDGARIVWYIDDEEQPHAVNSRTLTSRSGEVGVPMEVRADITERDGITNTITRIITPIYIDIVVEGLTHVPSFYEGRPLPSPGSQARASAIVYTGTSRNPATLTYRWEINNRILNNGAILGKLGTNFDMPLDRVSYLSVTVSDNSGIIGSKTIEISAAEPEVYFYEENPLRGQIPLALPKEQTVFGNQITVRAEPYYANRFSSSDDYIVRWRLNGQMVDLTNPQDPYEIILRNSGSSGQAALLFEMADLTSFPIQITKSTVFTFGS